MTRLLERAFAVRTAPDDAWRHPARVAEWPSWAMHIRRVELTPPGELSKDSAGRLHLAGGIRSTFKMTEFVPPSHWRWAGRFLWMTVHYDHRFEATANGGTVIRFVVDAEGLGVGVLGRLFAAIYRRNLDRAIPRLVRELEGSIAPSP